MTQASISAPAGSSPAGTQSKGHVASGGPRPAALAQAGPGWRPSTTTQRPRVGNHRFAPPLPRCLSLPGRKRPCHGCGLAWRPCWPRSRGSAAGSGRLPPGDRFTAHAAGEKGRGDGGRVVDGRTNDPRVARAASPAPRAQPRARTLWAWGGYPPRRAGRPGRSHPRRRRARGRRAEGDAPSLRGLVQAARGAWRHGADQAKGLRPREHLQGPGASGRRPLVNQTTGRGAPVRVMAQRSACSSPVDTSRKRRRPGDRPAVRAGQEARPRHLPEDLSGMARRNGT